MPMSGLTNTNNLIKIAVGVLAFFPGIALYRELIQVPPSIIGVAHIVSFSVSILVLVCIPLLSDQIRALTKKRAVVYAFIAVILGAMSLFGYLQFAQSHIVTAMTEEGENQFLIPLFPNREILEIVRPMEGTVLADSYRPALETSGRRLELRDRMKQESWDSFILMVGLLILSQILLVAPPVAAAWRATSDTG